VFSNLEEIVNAYYGGLIDANAAFMEAVNLTMRLTGMDRQEARENVGPFLEANGIPVDPFLVEAPTEEIVTPIATPVEVPGIPLEVVEELFPDAPIVPIDAEVITGSPLLPILTGALSVAGWYIADEVLDWLIETGFGVDLVVRAAEALASLLPFDPGSTIYYPSSEADSLLDVVEIYSAMISSDVPETVSTETAIEPIGGPGGPGGGGMPPMMPYHGGVTALMMAGGPPPEIVAYTWVANSTTFYRLINGQIAVQKRNGVWRVYRPHKNIVVSANPRVDTLLRADKKLTKLVRGLDTMIQRRRKTRK